jgi:hypothetical protein
VIDGVVGSIAYELVADYRKLATQVNKLEREVRDLGRVLARHWCPGLQVHRHGADTGLVG